MFQNKLEVLNDLGFYHTILDNEMIKDIKKRMGFLNMKSVDKGWRPNANLILAVSFKGEQAQLLLTKIQDMPISILYLVKDDKLMITNHRFDPSMYNNTVLFGELFKDTFVIHIASLGDNNEKTVDNLEILDGILFNKHKEDLDLEPIRLTIKEFYNNERDITWRPEYKAIIYLNPMVKGQHFIKFK